MQNCIVKQNEAGYCLSILNPHRSETRWTNSATPVLVGVPYKTKNGPICITTHVWGKNMVCRAEVQAPGVMPSQPGDHYILPELDAYVQYRKLDLKPSFSGTQRLSFRT